MPVSPSSYTLPDYTVPETEPARLTRVLRKSWIHVAVGAIILLLDIVTGPYILFPIFFIVPVALCAWYSNPRLAHALAFLLPLGRFLIAEFIEHPHALIYVIINCV